MSVYNFKEINSTDRLVEKLNENFKNIDFAMKNLDFEDNFTAQEKEKHTTGYTGTFRTKDNHTVTCVNGRIVSVK